MKCLFGAGPGEFVVSWRFPGISLIFPPDTRRKVQNRGHVKARSHRIFNREVRKNSALLLHSDRGENFVFPEGFESAKGKPHFFSTLSTPSSDGMDDDD